MSYDEIKLVYPLAEDMIRTFKEGVEQLQDTLSEMQSVANALEDGALLGQGGQAFTEAIRGKLCPAIGRLTDKFEELAEDVQDAIDFMREADEKSKGMF
jgi:WXG100 family type VII secretion target